MFVGALFVLCVLVAATPALAAPAPAGELTWQTGHHTPVLAGWFDSLTTYLEGSLNNRARIVQFALVAMMLALWIIWWRK
jgi:hypothetical protein